MKCMQTEALFECGEGGDGGAGVVPEVQPQLATGQQCDLGTGTLGHLSFPHCEVGVRPASLPGGFRETWGLTAKALPRTRTL